MLAVHPIKIRDGDETEWKENFEGIHHFVPHSKFICIIFGLNDADFLKMMQIIEEKPYLCICIRRVCYAHI